MRTLQDAGHKVSVILPHIQRSWIGKAHFVGEIAKPTYYRPGKLYEYDGTTHSRPLPKDAKGEEWVLVDGTPATCAQLGLYHFFQDQGPVDLVVSGPNYGRNSTALLSLSSGTIGGAMEATLCHKKAIAISYAFYSKDRDLELIASASCLSAKLIEYLHANWAQDVDLYSINIPLIKDVEHHKIMYTDSLSNRWLSGCPYKAIEPRSEEEPDPSAREEEIRHGGIDEGAPSGKKEGGQGHARHTHKHFQWSPAFTDVAKSIEANPPGNDGWALGEGYTRLVVYIHSRLRMLIFSLVSRRLRQTSCMLRCS